MFMGQLTFGKRRHPKPTFNVAIFVKWVPVLSTIRTIGIRTIFVDILDLGDVKVPIKYHVIVQNKYEALDRFGARRGRGLQATVHVIEHPYSLSNTTEGNISSAALATNDSGSASEYKSLYDDKEIRIPGAQSKLELLDGVDSQTYPKKKLQILTFMRGPRSNGVCPRAHGRNVRYDCVIYQTEKSGEVHLVRLLHARDGASIQANQGSRDLVPKSWTKAKVNELMTTTNWGTAWVYNHVFSQYDAVVVLVRRSKGWHRRGTVQRLINAMMSGTPVILERLGLVEFYLPESYPCWFKVSRTFESVLEAMRNQTVKAACVKEGMEIASKFHPRAIVAKYLEAFGLLEK
mmetsp:Transcript_35319/g.88309  ORF Transcript_35319/g.88309 Transcript_35319/m.88309 type:complete len:347 (-) Transcript_35319:81-1121(-)